MKTKCGGFDDGEEEEEDIYCSFIIQLDQPQATRHVGTLREIRNSSQ